MAGLLELAVDETRPGLPLHGSPLMLFPNISRSYKYPYAKYASSALNEAIVITGCLLSALGSLTIILSYAFWKDIRTTSRKILLFLSLSDFLIAISNLLGLKTSSVGNVNEPQNGLCVAQSFITNSVSIMSFLWTLTLALYLYLVIIMNSPSLGKRILPYCHVVNWSCGPIINLIALRSHKLGYSADALTGGWCWIYHDQTKSELQNDEILWHLLDAKAIEIVVYTAICVIYLRIKVKIHKELKIRSQQSMQPDVLKSAKSADRKLVFVPILLVLGRIWSMVRFIDVLVEGLHPYQTEISNAQKALLTLQGFGDSIQGFLNCLLFCFLNPKVYNHIREAFVYYLCCKRGFAASGNNDDQYHPKQDRQSLNGSLAPEDSQALLEQVVRVKKYGSN